MSTKNDISLWQNMWETQKTLDYIKKELAKTKDECFDFGGLLRSSDIQREYVRAVGYYQGLKYIEQIFINLKQESTNETT